MRLDQLEITQLPALVEPGLQRSIHPIHHVEAITREGLDQLLQNSHLTHVLTLHSVSHYYSRDPVNNE